MEIILMMEWKDMSIDMLLMEILLRIFLSLLSKL